MGAVNLALDRARASWPRPSWRAPRAGCRCRPGCSAADGMFASPIARLVQQLGKLPGIGEKTAARLAFHILRALARGRGRAGRGDRRGQAEDPALLDLLRPHRGRSRAPSAATRAATPAWSAWWRSPRTSSPSSAPAATAAATTCCTACCRPLDGIGPDDLRVAELVPCAAAPAGGRRSSEVDPRDQPQRRGGGDRRLPGAAAPAARRARHPHRHRRPDRRRARVRRPGDAGARPRRSPRDVARIRRSPPTERRDRARRRLKPLRAE